MAKRALIFSPHPDDQEIGCSGTCKKLENQGYEIVSIITVRPSAEVNENRDKRIVTSEMTASYQTSGWRYKVFNTDLHNNGRPNLVVNNNTMTQLRPLIEDAEIVILPNPEDYHQDHRATAELAFPLIRNVPNIWYMHIHPYSLTYKTMPNMFVDISNQWKFKKQLLNCYPSALSVADINNIETTNRYYGLHTKTSHAEAFTMIKKCI